MSDDTKYLGLESVHVAVVDGDVRRSGELLTPADEMSADLIVVKVSEGLLAVKDRYHSTPRLVTEAEVSSWIWDHVKNGFH
jgi:hypothetical protein